MNTKGALAERAAANYLKEKKYKLLDFNYYTRFGEIDLICKDRKNIVFVEVKARSKSIARPKEFVDYNKQQKMIKTAQIYLKSKPVKLSPRFDVIEVFIENNEIKSIQHLENAFQLD